MNQPTCETCRYFKPSPIPNGRGECWRYPPTLLNPNSPITTIHRNPTLAILSCGEHSPKEPPGPDSLIFNKDGWAPAVAWKGGISRINDPEPGIGIAELPGGMLVAVMSYKDQVIPEGAKIHIKPDPDGVWSVCDVLD